MIFEWERRQDDVGFSRERFVFRAVDREAVAETVEHRAQGQLRFCVTTPDAGHDLGTFFGGEDVGHGEKIEARHQDSRIKTGEQGKRRDIGDLRLDNWGMKK